MAKKGRRRYRRYLKGQINHDLVLGALVSDTVTGSNVADTVTETTWCSSVKATYALQGFTAATNDGPVQVGFAHSAYSDAQIEEYLESSASWEVGNLTQQEIAKRKIRSVGIFDAPPATPEQATTLNDGKPITTKANWMLNTGQTLRFWAYNTGQGTMIAGASVFVHGHANLWPK